MAREIPLTKGQVAIVDDEDFEWLNQWKWYARWSKFTQSFYAVRNSSRSDGTRYTILMHREILGLHVGDMRRGDHVQAGDTLNNKRYNLRISTALQNNQNARKRLDNSTGFKGVAWHDCGQWVARIRVEAKLKYLGLFGPKDEGKIEAARAYDRAAIKHYGEFALLNFPREDYVNG